MTERHEDDITKSGLFDGYWNSEGIAFGEGLTFAMGFVALSDGRQHDELVLDAMRLRARVYIDQYGWLPESRRGGDGTERDEYDQYASHFCVASKDEEAPESLRVVSNVRYIEREACGELPIERDYNITLPITENAVEISRFLTCGNTAREDRIASHMLFASVVGILSNVSVAAYAILEEKLIRHIRIKGYVLDELGEPVVDERYGCTANIPVLIYPDKTLEQSVQRSQVNERFVHGYHYYEATKPGFGRLIPLLTGKVDRTAV